MSKLLAKGDSKEAQAIWAGVAKAAEACPEWARPAIKRSAELSAAKIVRLGTRAGKE